MGFFDKAFKLTKDVGTVLANSIAEKARSHFIILEKI